MINCRFLTLISIVCGLSFITNVYSEQVVNTDQILGPIQIANPVSNSKTPRVVIPQRTAQAENTSQNIVPVSVADTSQITNVGLNTSVDGNNSATQTTNSVQSENPVHVAMPMQVGMPTQLAITVDDLPGIGDLPAGVSRIDVENQMLAAFKKHNMPVVYGMVIVGEVQGTRVGQKIVDRWISSNNSVANHTYSHSDLAKVSSAFYIADIQKADDYLAKQNQTGSYKYFRFPYLSEGNTLAKRSAIRSYLFNNGYQIAPVTVNFSDYEWNDPYARCLKQNNTLAIAWLKKTYINQALQALDNAHYSSNILFHHDIKNILLVHLGPFDAVMMDDLLTAYEKQGVQFISLPEALSDPAYQLNRNPYKVQTYTLSKRSESRDEMNDSPLTTVQMSQELEHICRDSNAN